jgi:Erv1 / Alr family
MEDEIYQKFNPDIWGPHYWFFLHTLAFSYPNFPNAVTKRKYYDLIQNFPLFIPVTEIGNYFSQLLDKYPVTPYLDSRESFIRWTHFIHNKINVHTGKEEISLYESIDQYYMNYKAKPIIISERINMKKHYIFSALILLLILLIYMFYK